LFEKFKRRKMKKTTVTALFYTLLTPINVWTGYELGTENYNFAIPLVIIVMILEFVSVKYWFEAQTEEIKNAGNNHQDS
jgi:hypothetical protein